LAYKEEISLSVLSGSGFIPPIVVINGTAFEKAGELSTARIDLTKKKIGEIIIYLWATGVPVIITAPSFRCRFSLPKFLQNDICRSESAVVYQYVNFPINDQKIPEEFSRCVLNFFMRLKKNDGIWPRVLREEKCLRVIIVSGRACEAIEQLPMVTGTEMYLATDRLSLKGILENLKLD